MVITPETLTEATGSVSVRVEVPVKFGLAAFLHNTILVKTSELPIQVSGEATAEAQDE